MNLEEVKNIIYNLNPFVKYGFRLEVINSGKDILGIESIEFSSTEYNDRIILLNISEMKKEDKMYTFLMLKIKKVSSVDENEDTTLYLDEWMKEKGYSIEENMFHLHDEGRSLELLFSEFFSFVDKMFQLEDLKKIIRGQYWEYKPIDWRLFGK